ncbi:MAG: GGDEF domain-containing protein [Bdellovibrionales bacterium]
MRLAIAEDVNQMSRHLAPILEAAGHEIFLFNSFDDFQSLKKLKNIDVLLHFSNHHCLKWDTCNEIQDHYKDEINVIHLYSDSTKSHLPEESYKKSNFCYLSDPKNLLQKLQNIKDFGKSSVAMNLDLESFKSLDSSLSNLDFEFFGQAVCSLMLDQHNAEKAYFFDLIAFAEQKERESLIYIQRRRYLRENSFLSSNVDFNEESAKVIENIVSSRKGGIYHRDNFVDGSFSFHPIATEAEVLGYIVFENYNSLKEINTDFAKYTFFRLGLRYFELRQSAETLLQSYIDDVTQLYNQRYLIPALDACVKDAERMNSPFSVLFIDVDHFKKVNDQHGHVIGSGILAGIGEILAVNIREEDFSFRYGGDEFIIILRDAETKHAEQIAERIRAQVEDKVFQLKGVDVQVTISIGIASFPIHAKKSIDIIQMADEAMYYGKNKSRNIVYVAS